MKVIDVEGVPEPLARALDAMVKALRQQIGTPRKYLPRVDLPKWPGKVLGRLTREEIYADVG